MVQPVCEICHQPSREIVIIQELDGKIVCMDCFRKNQKEILNAMAAKGSPVGGQRSDMRMNPLGVSKTSSDDFLINLSKEIENNFEPVLFREKEVERLTRVLLRKTKNNPVLIGEAGVGKTAIVDLLANMIANGKIPRLKDYTIYSLNIAALMSGTKFRGEFESNVQELIKALDSKSILFIDEMHMVMGAGGNSQNDIDLANLLKPYLSKGKIKVIGATTLSEYRKIEKDPAFTRRFQSIKVEPLNEEQTLEVIKKIRPSFEEHHGVELPDDCLKLLVNLSGEYIRDRYFPDKAIDVLDETCSLVSIRNNTMSIKDVKELETEFKELLNTLELSNASQIKQEIANAKKTHKVDKDTILKVVENMTNIPVTSLTKEQQTRLLNLENELNKRIIGQEEAIKTLARAVRRSRVKIKKITKPTVLFLSGPTGVGKTESAKALAESLFGSEDALIRFDMSEYMEKHSISKLIGTAPGYIGYEDEGQLTEKVRRNPYCIILLDEFEKAHPQIARLLLQAFDDGRLTDSKGRTVDFRNALFLLTSNVGVTEKPSVGFGNSTPKDKTSNALEKLYPPEFLNRIDEKIEFNHLTKQDILKIVDLRINEYQNSLHEKGIELKLDSEAKAYLAEKGYSPTMGARPLTRLITREVEDLIVEYILDSEQITSLFITGQDGHLHFA